MPFFPCDSISLQFCSSFCLFVTSCFRSCSSSFVRLQSHTIFTLLFFVSVFSLSISSSIYHCRVVTVGKFGSPCVPCDCCCYSFVLHKSTAYTYLELTKWVWYVHAHRKKRTKNTHTHRRLSDIHNEINIVLSLALHFSSRSFHPVTLIDNIHAWI